MKNWAHPFNGRPAPAAGLALFLAVAVSVATRAIALPLFDTPARSNCAGCHLSAPTLNAAGMRFLREGYRAPGAGPEPAHVPGVSTVLELGAGISRIDTLGEAGARGSSTTDGEFRGPSLDVHSAGALAEHVSFHVEASLDSAGGTVRLPVAAVQIDDLAPNGALALRVGAFDAGLPFISRARRLTAREYLAPVEVDARGLELVGSHGAWACAVGMMNSSRSGSRAGQKLHRLEDTYARVTRDFAGQVVGARMLFDRQDSNISWHAWLQHLQFQAGGLLGANRLWFVPAYTLDRFDDRPAPGIHQRTQYATFEAVALLGGRREWTLCGRWEYARTAPTALTAGDHGDLEALRLSREISPRVRAALEASRTGAHALVPGEVRADATLQLAL